MTGYSPSPNCKYRIAFSAKPLEGKIPAGDPRWGKFNSSFINMELWPEQIRDYIRRGHAFTTWHHNTRKSGNFLCGQHYALDFDGDESNPPTVDNLLSNPFVAERASLIYTTPSHTDEYPRARVLFLIDSPIEDAEIYTAGAAAINSLFGAADQKTKDACRFFYGSMHCDGYFVDKVLDLDTIKYLIERNQQQPAISRPIASSGKMNVNAFLESIIAKAKPGERNNLGYWMACRLRDEGIDRNTAEECLRQYAQRVSTATSVFSEREALLLVRSAYGG